jgi:hypothetical protein
MLTPKKNLYLKWKNHKPELEFQMQVPILGFRVNRRHGI